jgi:zinc-binding in reverse transcriptase
MANFREAAVYCHGKGSHYLNLVGVWGFIDLQLQNKALLLKWLWVANSNNDSLWADSLTTINTNLPLTRDSIALGTGFFFLQLQDLLQLMPVWDATVSIPIDGRPTWDLTSDHMFTVKSAYNFINDPGIPTTVFGRLWSTDLPPRIKFLKWNTLHNRLNMADNLLRKGWPTITSCIMCDSATCKTVDHLLITCPTASALHYAVTGRARSTNEISAWTSWQMMSRWEGQQCRAPIA